MPQNVTEYSPLVCSARHTSARSMLPHQGKYEIEVDVVQSACDVRQWPYGKRFGTNLMSC
jgi:hypothetical protein